MSSIQPNQIHGPIAALLTPRTASGLVDRDALEVNARLVLECGARGLCLSGATGEYTIATEQALATVEQGTDPAWAVRAVEAVHQLANRQEPFTPDDVWDYLTDQGVEQPREPRALGPIIKAELRAHRIKLEGYATSRRRHGALIRSYTGA